MTPTIEQMIEWLDDLQNETIAIKTTQGMAISVDDFEMLQAIRAELLKPQSRRWEMWDE